MTNVVFLLIPGLHLLDLAGPAQAFGTAANLGCSYQLRYVGEQEDVPTAQGVTIRAALDWPELTKDDLIIVPGWRAAPVMAGTGPLADATGCLHRDHERRVGCFRRPRRLVAEAAGRRPADCAGPVPVPGQHRDRDFRGSQRE